MKTDEEYIKDLSEIRQMMEKSTKFLSLAGWSGILAGIYALTGVYIFYLRFNSAPPKEISEVISIGIAVLLLAISTCIFLSYKKAKKNNEVFWNATSRRLVLNMAIPLVTGGILILILISKYDDYDLIIPLTLIFYGLSLVNASRFTFDELRYMGILEITLGLISTYSIGIGLVGLICWSLGFGVLHIIYGIYMHWRYER